MCPQRSLSQHDERIETMKTCTYCRRTLDDEDLIPRGTGGREFMCVECGKLSPMQRRQQKHGQIPSTLNQEAVARRVGADVVLCPVCDETVEVSLSVRRMENGNGRMTRVCVWCAGTGVGPRPACKRGEHSVVLTPLSAGWDSSKYRYEPLPDGTKIGLCRDCDEAMTWRQGHWVSMTWPLLAHLWESIREEEVTDA